MNTASWTDEIIAECDGNMAFAAERLNALLVDARSRMGGLAGAERDAVRACVADLEAALETVYEDGETAMVAPF